MLFFFNSFFYFAHYFLVCTRYMQGKPFSFSNEQRVLKLKPTIMAQKAESALWETAAVISMLVLFLFCFSNRVLLELSILLPWPPESRDYRHMLPHPTDFSWFINFRSFYLFSMIEDEDLGFSLCLYHPYISVL
jgi:hypothetical protein